MLCAKFCPHLYPLKSITGSCARCRPSLCLQRTLTWFSLCSASSWLTGCSKHMSDPVELPVIMGAIILHGSAVLRF